MTGAELAGAILTLRTQAIALDQAIDEIQSRLPAATTIGSAALVSGALAALGFGVKWSLAGKASDLRRRASDLIGGLQADADAAAGYGEESTYPAELADRSAIHALELQALQLDVAALSGEVQSFGSAAALAEIPASKLVDAAEDFGDKVGGIADAISWWSKYGLYVILALAAGVVLFFFFSDTGKALRVKALGR